MKTCFFVQLALASLVLGLFSSCSVNRDLEIERSRLEQSLLVCLENSEKLMAEKSALAKENADIAEMNEQFQHDFEKIYGELSTVKQFKLANHSFISKLKETLDRELSPAAKKQIEILNENGLLKLNIAYSLLFVKDKSDLSSDGIAFLKMLHDKLQEPSDRVVFVRFEKNALFPSKQQKAKLELSEKRIANILLHMGQSGLQAEAIAFSENGSEGILEIDIALNPWKLLKLMQDY